MSQGKLAALRHFCGSRSMGIPFRWSQRHGSTLVSTPIHATAVSLSSSSSSSSSSSRQHSFCPLVGPCFNGTEKSLGHDASNVVISPIDILPTRALGTRCRCDGVEQGAEKNECQLEELLSACIVSPSTEKYESLVMSTAELYKASPSRCWALHSRTLANFGVQCLVDQNASQAVGLLRQAVEIIAFFEGETAVLHLRVILANALACEGLCFAALREYETALSVMRDYPVESSLSQVISGKQPRMPLSRTYILEDFDRFLANDEMVLRALSQGHKETHSCTDALEKTRIALVMARLQRRVGEREASLALYTSSLHMLLDSPDPEMEIRVMHDMGLLLCFEIFDVARGLPYLQSAAEMSFDRAREELEEMRRRSPSRSSNGGCCLNGSATAPQETKTQEGLLCIRRASSILLDTAVCFAENEEVGKALALFEESIMLMSEIGMQRHSAWARMKYADALATASLVDKAIHVYLEAMGLIQSIERSDENLQLACMGMVVPLMQSEVEGRLAYCFQVHVRDYRRACVHFCQAIRRCGVHVGCPFEVLEKEKVVPRVEEEGEVDSETLCWMLENYASCCERVGNVGIAKEVLEHRISVEKALGGSCASPLLRLAQLHRTANLTRALELYILLLGLPEDVIEPDTLLESAYGFAGICYSSKEEEMESALFKAAGAYLDGIKTTTAAPSTPSNVADAKEINSVIITSFKRSAGVMMAGHAVERVTSKVKRDDDLQALMTLSRGGFFCQRRGDEAGAEELYRLAVDYTQHAHVNTEDYSRELAIMLANYATVMVHKDVQLAQQLYEQAVNTCPTEENVLTAAASFFVLTANYAGGRACIQRMIDAAADRTTLPWLYGKLAWLGVVCWDELPPDVHHECLQHLLLALGLEPDNIFLIVAANRPSPLGDSVSEEFKQKLLHGITSSHDQDTVSLASYVAQTKLPQEGSFVNECYKAALARFPHSATILVNYAKFCADYGAVALARKYYAKAFSLSHKDPRSSECYADYLAFLNTRGEQQQVVVGECLLRFQVERCARSASAPTQTQAHLLYGKYLVTYMPSPSIPVALFEEAIRRNQADSRATALYCSFLWNVYARALDTKRTPDVKQQLARRVESCYLNGLKFQPQSIVLLAGLGALYVELGGRFDDAVRVLKEARELSPHNLAVNRLLCAAFHDEWVKEHEKPRVKNSTRLQALLETTRQLYEVTVAMESTDRLVLMRYCQFALYGLQNAELAARLAQRLRELPNE